MEPRTICMIGNGERAPRSAIVRLEPTAFREAVLTHVAAGSRILAFFGVPRDRESAELFAALGDGANSKILLFSTGVDGSYFSLTPDCPQAHYFEREIAEQCGVRPEGHPWLQPVRALRAAGRFYQMHGEAVHEVGVGPVHAGVIEPGHFRFQCYGETVHHLEIALGYQHRGIESSLRGGPTKITIHRMETAAGDSSIAHATAYAQAVEALSFTKVPPRADGIRAIALELERIANHVGDLGALAGDVGYLPAAAWCGRLRGDYLNTTARICGNRFGRGLVRPGGVHDDIEPARAGEMAAALAAAEQDTVRALDLLFSSSSVLARFEGTGTLAASDADALGLVGVAARACGLERDARLEFPAGHYRFYQIPVSTFDTGDVYARASVRKLEIQRSLDFLKQQLGGLPASELRYGAGDPSVRLEEELEPDSVAVSVVEGWRGEVVHVALTGADGRFEAYKIVDPSFHNWQGLAMALRGQQISDFPLCNKSFNLSYCGHDL